MYEGSLVSVLPRAGREVPRLCLRLLDPRAVAGRRLIDLARAAVRNQRHHVDDRLDAAFVADDVNVTTDVDEARTRLDELGLAAGIVRPVQGERACLDYHDARPWVRVPTEAAARRDTVLENPDVGLPFCVELRLPCTRVLGGLSVEAVELADGEDRAGHPIHRGRGGGGRRGRRDRGD